MALLSLFIYPLPRESDLIVDWSRLEAIRERQAPGEPDLVLSLIDTFALDACERVACANASALRRNLAGVMQEAHALRGSAGLMGAEPLRRDAERLERAARDGEADVIADLLAQVEASLAATLTALSACPFRE